MQFSTANKTNHTCTETSCFQHVPVSILWISFNFSFEKNAMLIILKQAKHITSKISSNIKLLMMNIKQPVTIKQLLTITCVSFKLLVFISKSALTCC